MRPSILPVAWRNGVKFSVALVLRWPTLANPGFTGEKNSGKERLKPIYTTHLHDRAKEKKNEKSTWQNWSTDQFQVI